MPNSAMPHATLADATDLHVWAGRRDAQAEMRRLVRRLVHATVARVTRAGFAAGEGVQLGGWDGIVACAEGTAFVPDGVSVWEFGVTSKVRAKADEDYDKRCADPRGVTPAETTYVFVTPRRWGAKDDWVEERRAEGTWRDVRAYDADDLEEWLELAPGVHVWLSARIGKHPDGAADLGGWWADWADATDPPLPAALVLAGRDTVEQRVAERLQAPPAPLALQGESREDALAAFAAAVQQMSGEVREAVLARTVVVTNGAAWRRLAAADQPLVLVQTFDA